MEKYNDKKICKGLLFIKSMMSENNLNAKKEHDLAQALKVGVVCKQVAIDDGASLSVDRSQMRQLLELLETTAYEVLVVEDAYDLTRDPEDLRKIIDRINSFGVIVFELKTMSARFNNYAVEC